MITPNQFKNGMTVVFDGTLYTIVFFQHVKPGKGGAFVRTKLKNLKLGTVIDRTFRVDENIEEAFVENKKMQFLYHAGDAYHFMDLQTYDEVIMQRGRLSDTLKFLKDNLEVNATVFKGEIVDIQLPVFIDLKVTHTEPGRRADTARQALKPATLETGTVIQVPLFVNPGDIIHIDTRTGEYISRA